MSETTLHTQPPISQFNTAHTDLLLNRIDHTLNHPVAPHASTLTLPEQRKPLVLTAEEVRQRQINLSWQEVAPRDEIVSAQTETAWTERVAEKAQTEVQESEKHIAELNAEIEAHITESLTDKLTGLPNRDGFMYEAKKMFENNKDAVHIGFLDIDHFKSLNDTFGHDNADKVLIKLASILKQHITDTGIGVVGRRSGDEFEMAFHNLDDELLTNTLDSILTEVSNIGLTQSQTAGNDYEVVDKRTADNNAQSKPWDTSVSIGVAAAQKQQSFEKVLVEADLNMLKAKEAGRNRYQIS